MENRRIMCADQASWEKSTVRMHKIIRVLWHLKDQHICFSKSVLSLIAICQCGVGYTLVDLVFLNGYIYECRVSAL